MNYNNNVFINCPFDTEFDDLKNAIVFAVFDCGFTPRCAAEFSDNGSVRFDNIKQLIFDCKFGIHDISRTELDDANHLPRFNMPLELGVFIGAAKYGRGNQKHKSILILDKEPYRYQKFMSDIAGQDIRVHANDEKKLISHVRNWLSSGSKQRNLPGGADIYGRYQGYKADLPALCQSARIEQAELQYNDYANFVSAWLVAAVVGGESEGRAG
jgi:hypothetical protein